MHSHDRTPRKGGFLALPALFAAVAAGFGLGFGRRPYRPRGEVAAPGPARTLSVAPMPSEADAPPPVPASPHPVAGAPAQEAAAQVVASDIVPAEPEPVPSESMPEAAPRCRLTPLGQRVVAALGGCAPLRKHEIAKLVGIGRGSAVRIVDRLIDGGWMVHHGGGLYGLA